MTIQEIKERVEAIRSTESDPEAHEMEDNLRRQFLEYLKKEGPMEISAKANLLLMTQEMIKDRWYE